MLKDQYYRTTKFRGIIPFSGGIDSTAAVYRILKANPSDNYVLFTVSLINGTSATRSILEEKAVNEILQKLIRENISNFSFKKLSFDYSSLGPPPVWDSEIINFMASIIIQDKPEITEFIDGAIKDDYLQDGFSGRLDKIADILYTTTGRNKEDLDILFPLKELTKYEVMSSIPSELLSLTWSCRYPEIGAPHTFVRCHKCPQCKVLDQVILDHPGEFDHVEHLQPQAILSSL